MSIVISIGENGCFPIIMCDECDRRIRDGLGNVVWLEAVDGSGRGGPLFLHKDCDRMYGDTTPGTVDLWLSLDVFLSRLVEHAGVSEVRA